jgi:hypothetical protein
MLALASGTPYGDRRLDCRKDHGNGKGLVSRLGGSRDIPVSDQTSLNVGVTGQLMSIFLQISVRVGRHYL